MEPKLDGQEGTGSNYRRSDRLLRWWWYQEFVFFTRNPQEIIKLLN